jgi:plasmid stabilization system protein ParE
VTEVTFHPEAAAEYEHALAWYLGRSPQAAAQFEVAFVAAIEAIQSNPTMFPLCDGLHRFVLLKRYPFSLVYGVNGDQIRVLAVAHSKRRLGYWSGRA